MFYMARLSRELTLGCRPTDCICRNACCPAGVLKGCQKEGVSWDVFFSPPERPQSWKGHGLHKNRSERSPCYSVRSLPLMLPPSHPFSVTLHFSLPSPSSANNLCQPLYFPLLISSSSLFLQLEILAADVVKSFETDQLFSWFKKNERDFFRNSLMVHVNLP